jgi:hypothetical protein
MLVHGQMGEKRANLRSAMSLGCRFSWNTIVLCNREAGSAAWCRITR